MALQFCDGFDSYSSAAELIYKWTVNTSTCTVQTTGGRFGAGSVRFSDTGTVLRKTGLNATDDYFFNFSFYPRALPTASTTFFTLGDSSDNTMNLRMNTTGNLIMTARGTTTALTGGTGAGVVMLNQWNYVSGYFKGVDGGTGRAKLYLNGSLQFDITLDTISTGNVNTDRFSFMGLRTGAGNEVDYDDIAVYDDSGTFMNTQITADYKIETLRPTADSGGQQWTPSTGVDHYALVDDAPGVNTTDYIDGVNASDRDLFTLANPTTPATTIHALVVNTIAKRTDTAPINLKLLVQQNAADALSADIALNSVLSTQQHAVYQNPDGPANWDSTTLNAALIGVQVGT